MVYLWFVQISGIIINDDYDNLRIWHLECLVKVWYNLIQFPDLGTLKSVNNKKL